MRAILVGELRKESRQGGKKLRSEVPERKVFLAVRPSSLSLRYVIPSIHRDLHMAKKKKSFFRYYFH